MQATSYDQIAQLRTTVREVRVTFAYGQGNTAPMRLAVADLEALLAGGDILPDAECVTCGEHVAECPDWGHLLVDWPERTYTTTWGERLTAAQLD